MSVTVEQLGAGTPEISGLHFAAVPKGSSYAGPGPLDPSGWASMTKFRYYLGGEKFGLVVPDLDEDEAMEHCQRVAREVGVLVQFCREPEVNGWTTVVPSRSA